MKLLMMAMKMDTSSDLPILDLGIVHEGDEKFEDWETIQDLFHEAGIRTLLTI